jgi:UDP-2-acetamido-3-amino-2,3-dideoxy-glucuronate N-acetyltransferase
MMEKSPALIHKTADVQTTAIGAGTRVWQFVVILPGAVIGSDSNICSHCLIENKVTVGDRTTIKSGVHLWDGVQLGNDVFVGPNATFTNDKFPRSKVYPESFLETIVEDGASIGAGAIILPGLRIGKRAMVAAGAVVTTSVPPNAIVSGSPARIAGYVDADPSHTHEFSATPNSGAPLSRGPYEIGVGGAKVHRLKSVTDIRGDLSVGEFERDIPFAVKRYFLVYNVPSTKTRGEHAHKTCHQFLICVKGSCAVVVDDGTSRREISLDSPELGIHLPPMTWGIQYKYSSDAVLLVFASELYDAADYIRDHADFLRLVAENKSV